MKKVYKLQVGNIAKQCIEHEYFFSSLKTAEESKFEMINYLNFNHSLNVDKQTYFPYLNMTNLDDKFNVSVITHDIKKQVLLF